MQCQTIHILYIVFILYIICQRKNDSILYLQKITGKCDESSIDVVWERLKCLGQHFLCHFGKYVWSGFDLFRFQFFLDWSSQVLSTYRKDFHDVEYLHDWVASRVAKVGKVGEWSKALDTNKIQLLVLFLEVNVTGPCSIP